MMKASQLEILPKIEKEMDQKKARLLTLIILGITLIPSLIFYLVSSFRQGKLNLSSFSFLSPTNLFSGESKDSLDKKDNLSIKLNKWAGESLAGLPGEWSVRIQFLEKDFIWGINDRDQFQAASLIKLPIVASFYRLVEEGELSLDDVYVLEESDKSNGAGNLQYQPQGTELTLGELASLALSQSDNTAQTVLMEKMDDEVVDQFISQWGMTRTNLEDNLTSAKDVALFFYQLYHHKIVGEEFTERMLADLTDTIFEDRIPAGVPQGIRVAHKVGTETEVTSDGGIIFVPGKPFILIILSQETNVNVAKKEFPGLVNDLYWLVLN